MPRDIRVLLIDDSVATRKMLIRSLEDTRLAKFHFQEAADGVDALEKYRPGGFDLMMIDIEMPRMDGLEFLRALRRKHPRCPASVMMTMESNRERMLLAVNDAGADALLLKPLNTDRLQRGLQKLIDSIPDPNGPWTIPYGDSVGEAMTRVMRMIAGIDLVPSDEPFSATTGNTVISMISIYGEIHWTISLGFDEEAAVGVTSKLAGVPIDFESEDLGDAIGEVTNQVAGELKRALINRGLSVNISLPTVIAATQMRWLVHSVENVSHDTVRYTTPLGKMRVSLTLGQSPEIVL